MRPWLRRLLIRATAFCFLSAPVPALTPQVDAWQDLANAWNPFADAMNHGKVDYAQWKKVVKVVHRIEGEKHCSAE